MKHFTSGKHSLCNVLRDDSPVFLVKTGCIPINAWGFVLSSLPQSQLDFLSCNFPTEPFAAGL